MQSSVHASLLGARGGGHWASRKHSRVNLGITGFWKLFSFQMWQAPFPHLYIFEHFQTFVWSNSHFVLPISDLTAFIWAAAPIGGKVQKWSKASGHWAASYVQVSGPRCTTFSRYTTHCKATKSLSSNYAITFLTILGGAEVRYVVTLCAWGPRALCSGQSHSNPLSTCAGSSSAPSLSISNPDLIELYVSPDVSFASLSKQKVMELFGKFLISQLHS